MRSEKISSRWWTRIIIVERISLQRSALGVTVMDIEDFKKEVLGWHCPHLLYGGNHVYLAYWAIRGASYEAVGFRAPKDSALFD